MASETKVTRQPIELDYPYTIDEVATIMNVHPETVKGWYQTGRLTIVRIGHKTIRILGSDLIAFIKSERVEADFIKRVRT